MCIHTPKLVWLSILPSAWSGTCFALDRNDIRPITRVDITEAAEHRRKHVQDHSKYRSEAQQLSTSNGRLTRSREEYSSNECIQDGDLVMWAVLNRKSKMDPKWDGPFVAISSTDKDVYQLSSPNGHVLQNLINSVRLGKLSLLEIEKYTGEFWNASHHLKLHERRAKLSISRRARRPQSVESLRRWNTM